MATTLARSLLFGLLCLALSAHAADSQSRLESSEFSDRVVGARIRAEFAKSESLNAANIQVSSAKGAITLTGVAQSQVDADRATALAQGVRGVVTVRNDIQIR